MTKNITISIVEYNQLVEDQMWLRCLQNAGLDNWVGIDYAYELKQELDEEETE